MNQHALAGAELREMAQRPRRRGVRDRQRGRVFKRKRRRLRAGQFLARDDVGCQRVFVDADDFLTRRGDDAGELHAQRSEAVRIAGVGAEGGEDVEEVEGAGVDMDLCFALRLWLFFEDDAVDYAWSVNACFEGRRPGRGSGRGLGRGDEALCEGSSVANCDQGFIRSRDGTPVDVRGMFWQVDRAWGGLGVFGWDSARQGGEGG